MRKPATGIILFFSIGVFLIVTITMAITGLIAGLLFQTGLLSRPHPTLILLIFCGVTILISTLLSGVVGRKALAPVIRVTEATKEITRGNYDVRLNEDIPAAEIQQMAVNFNRMAEQLGNTETFRSDFITNVSHEFKTPLSAIEGYATLLQNDALTEEERRDYTGRILAGTRRLSTLTGSILRMSSLENQNILKVSKPFSLDEQIRQVILLSEPEWSGKNIDLDIDLERVDYTGNQNLLAQVWQNIFDNAVKFVGQDGSIRVTLRGRGGEVAVSVADDGAGMPRAVVERVFEKFYQGDKSHGGSGNGLGLALAKRIVELHGGTIEVSSREGRGSTFTVRLPARDAS